MIFWFVGNYWGNTTYILIFYYVCCEFQPDEGEQSRPEVREEDLVEAKDKLGLKGEVKSKTFEVMEECGKYWVYVLNMALKFRD